MERIILNANEGKILTDGQIYGTTIFLEVGKDPSIFYEIGLEEYEKRFEEEEREEKIY